MKTFKSFPDKKNTASSQKGDRRNSFQEAVNLGASMALAKIKNVFPNLDPGFFTPTYSLNMSKKDDDLPDPYNNNSWVYAAVNAIATNLIQLPKVLDLQSTTEEKEMITEHPVLELLEKPNPLMDGPTFWENIILDLMLPTPKTKGGQCFIIAESGKELPVNLKKGEIPMEFYPFSDEFFKPILAKEDNSLLGWEYNTGGAKNKKILYKPEELIRIHLVDPMNPLKGMAPIWPARQTLRSDIKSSKMNENYFDNNASLGGTLITDAELEGDTAKELKDSFEEAYAGQDNAGRIALLHSGVRYEQFKQTHQDMQFLDQKKFTREEVLAVYRVPKFILTVYEDLNFATANAAERAFWTMTLLPLDWRILRGFNNQWLNFLENGRYQLASDFSKVVALQPDLTERLKQALDLWKMQIPVSEINRRLELQLEIDSFTWLETFLVNFNQLPADIVADPSFHEEEEEETEEDELEDTAATPTEEDLNETEEEKANKVTDNVLKTLENLGKKSAKEDKIRESYTDNVLIPDEKRFTKITNDFLRTQRNKVLDNIDSWAKEAKTVHKDENLSLPPEFFLPPKKSENKRLQKSVKNEYVRQAENEGKVVEEELGELVDWEVSSPEMTKVIKDRLKQITSINTTTYKRLGITIGEVIETGVEEGKNSTQIARDLKKAVNKVYSGRINSKTIARTETASIHSQTRMNIYKTEGIEKVKWLTAGDELVRSSDEGNFPHDVLNGAVANLKDGFNNGEKIKFPLDPSASPSNIINCRCMVIAER